jgi:SAM-dependent methyltransferase
VAAWFDAASDTTGNDPNLPVYSSRAVAAHYAALNYLSPCEQALFACYLKSGMFILDLGVGGGRTTAYLSSLAGRYVGLDYSPAMVEACRTKYPCLEFHIADAADLSLFADCSFDAVIFSFNGIDYLFPDEKRAKCLQECRRILKSEAVLVFSSHNPRAILVRPLWDQRRVRSVAESLVGSQSIWLGLLTAAVTCAKVGLTVLRAATDSGNRILRRVPRAMFWRGKGWLRDSSHGGLTQHYATPSQVIAEAEEHGFQLLRVLGDDYPRTSEKYITDWYYYVFVKSAATEKTQSCV